MIFDTLTGTQDQQASVVGVDKSLAPLMAPIMAPQNAP